MLVELRVTNFMSFKDEQIFSLLPATATREFLKNTSESRVVPNGYLLSSAVCYGANAAGKSNLITAFAYVKQLLDESLKEASLTRVLPYHPFKFDLETSNKPSRFELIFVQNEIRYEYGFVVDADKIHEEWLFAYLDGSNRSQLWFQRPEIDVENPANWYFNERKLKGEKRNLVAKFMTPTRLFLAVAAPWNVQINTVYQWFASKLQVIGLHQSLSKNKLRELTARKILDDTSYRQSVLQMLKQADLGIVGLSVREETLKYPLEILKNFSSEAQHRMENDEVLIVELAHKSYLEDNAGVPISWNHESNGTQIYFSLAGVWEDALQSNHILVVDELDSSLHPFLIRALVKIFQERVGAGSQAQLIFNTHDVTLLDSAVFRRDQVWFIEKDHGGASHMYSLLEFKPRKGEALQKGYLAGRYGALPFVGE